MTSITHLSPAYRFNIQDIVSSAIYYKINKDDCFEDILLLYNIIQGITHSKIPAEFRVIIIIIIYKDSF